MERLVLTKNADQMLIVAFLYRITSGEGGEPVLDFANFDSTCSIFPDTDLLNCPEIGRVAILSKIRHW